MTYEGGPGTVSPIFTLLFVPQNCSALALASASFVHTNAPDGMPAVVRNPMSFPVFSPSISPSGEGNDGSDDECSELHLDGV